MKIRKVLTVMLCVLIFATVFVVVPMNVGADSISRIELTPAKATNTVGETYTVVARVLDSKGNPLQGVPVTFWVAGKHYDPDGVVVLTNAMGEAPFSYTGTRAGRDTISTTSGDHASPSVIKEWLRSVGMVIDELEHYVETVYNPNVRKVPGFIRTLGNERINAHITLDDGSMLTIGVRIENAKVVEFREGKISNPTMIAYANESVIFSIMYSDAPIIAFQEALAKGGITYEGVGIMNKMRLDVVTAVVWRYMASLRGRLVGSANYL